MQNVIKRLKVLIFGDPHFFNDAVDYNIQTLVVRMETDDEIRRGPVAGDIILPVGLHQASDILKMVRKGGFNPDFVFLGDESRMLWLYGIEDIEIPTIWYAIDTHFHRDWHLPYAAAFDCLFVAQPWYVELFAPYRLLGEMEYLPLFAPSAPPPMPEKREIPAVFVGTLEMEITRRRNDFFRKLGEKCDLRLEYGKYLPLYSNAKIVVNHASHNEINFRVFEAMYSGALLVTNRVPGIEELFINDRHLVLFDSWNVDDAAEKINTCLADENRRARIAWEGQRIVLGNHLSADRMRYVATVLSPRRLGDITRKRLENLDEVKERVRKAYFHFSTAVNLPQDTREFFSRLGQGLPVD